MSANTLGVSADTVSNFDAQAVKTTDATQNDKQVQLTVSSTDTSTAQSVQATTKALPQVKAVVLSATTDAVSDASLTVDGGR